MAARCPSRIQRWSVGRTSLKGDLGVVPGDRPYGRPESSSTSSRTPPPASRTAVPRTESHVEFTDVEQLQEALARERYLADRGLAVSVYLALTLRRPLLLEGEPGVGKTEIARTLARVLRRRLIRLQCYEGIDAGQALYEWDYSRQLLYARTLQEGSLDPRPQAAELYGPEFLVERPLLARRPRGRGGGAAGGRARPGRRGVRGLPAGGARRRRRDHPGDRDGDRRDAAGRSCSPRTAPASCTTRSSAAASTTGSTTPTREREVAIIRLRAPEASQALAESVAELVAPPARARPGQAARPRRGDRLDARARRARHRVGGCPVRRRDARLGGQGTRRPGHRPPRGERAARRVSSADASEPLGRVSDLAEALRDGRGAASAPAACSAWPAPPPRWGPTTSTGPPARR